MKIATFILLAFFALPLVANAYIPPAFFIYDKVAEKKPSTSKKQTATPSVLLSISKPTTGGTEDYIGEILLPSWQPTPGGWPTLSLLFSEDSSQLISSIERFGIPVASEAGLMHVSKEQAAAMKDPPRPFYQRDKRMFLKRYYKTTAWVHSVGSDRPKSVWIEKDTFRPLKIEAPCPAKVESLDWVKSGNANCSLEMRNVTGLRRGTYRNAKLTLIKDDVPILFLEFTKLNPDKNTEVTKLPEDVLAVVTELLH